MKLTKGDKALAWHITKTMMAQAMKGAPEGDVACPGKVLRDAIIDETRRRYYWRNACTLTWSGDTVHYCIMPDKDESGTPDIDDEIGFTDMWDENTPS